MARRQRRWFCSSGNENWEFDEHGLMRLRIASINDLPIKEVSANTTGRLAAARTVIRRSANSDSKFIRWRDRAANSNHQV
jgi:hypothetical protein